MALGHRRTREESRLRTLPIAMAFLVTASACGSTHASTVPDSASLRRLVVSLGKPNSPFRRLDDEVRRDATACVRAAGFPGWAPEEPEYVGRGLALPAISAAGDRYLTDAVTSSTPTAPSTTAPMDEDAPPSPFETGAIEAYLGAESDPRKAVSADVPGFGTIGFTPGGCLGDAYADVFGRDAAEWRISSMVLMNLSSRVRRGAESRDEVARGLRAWSDCMRSRGLVVGDPYDAPTAVPQAAPDDRVCRRSTRYEDTWNRAVDAELDGLDNDVQQRFADFDRLSAAALARLGRS